MKIVLQNMWTLKSLLKFYWNDLQEIINSKWNYLQKVIKGPTSLSVAHDRNDCAKHLIKFNGVN